MRLELIDKELKRGRPGPRERVAEAFAPQQLQIGRGISPSNLITSTYLSLRASKDPKEGETGAIEVFGQTFCSLWYERTGYQGQSKCRGT